MTEIIKKTSLRAFSALCMLITLTTMGMEPDYPQLQLEIPKNEKNYANIDATLFLHPFMKSAIYMPKEFYVKNLDRSSFKAAYGEPFVMTLLSDNKNSKCFIIPVPAKDLFLRNGGSSVQFTYPADPGRNVDENRFNAICAKHEEIPGKDFMEQYSSKMNKFYKKPYFTKNNAQEFIDNDLLTNAQEIITVDQARRIISTVLVAQHGTKGCPNDAAFIKLMTAPKIKPYGNSMHQFVIQRQTGQKQRTLHNTLKDAS